MPSSFSTPDDKSTPKGLIFFLINSILFKFIPPDRNQGLLVFKFLIIFQSKLLAFPPGNSFLLVCNQIKSNLHHYNYLFFSSHSILYRNFFITFTPIFFIVLI